MIVARMLSVATWWWINGLIVSWLQANNWTNDAHSGQQGPEFSDTAVAERINPCAHPRSAFHECYANN
jgi:hypothetical protein